MVPIDLVIGVVDSGYKLLRTFVAKADMQRTKMHSQTLNSVAWSEKSELIYYVVNIISDTGMVKAFVN